jgi:excisionase family DNA binding protein
MTAISGQPKLLLTAVEVAESLSISIRTLERWLSSGRLLRPIQIGASRRWKRAELEAWVENGCPKCCS